jgi:hypothetical protein
VASIGGIRRPNITLGWLEAGRFRIQAPRTTTSCPRGDLRYRRPGGWPRTGHGELRLARRALRTRLPFAWAKGEVQPIYCTSDDKQVFVAIRAARSPPRATRVGGHFHAVSRASVCHRRPHANRPPGCLAGLLNSDRRRCRVRKTFALTGAIRTASGALTGDSAITATAIPDVAGSRPLLLRRHLSRATLGLTVPSAAVRANSIGLDA